MAGTKLSSVDITARDAFFGRVIKQHATLLYRVAYSVLRHPAEAEDAVADALLKLLRTGGWQEVRSERAFLARSVWRSALDRLAARPPTALEATEVVLYDSRPSPEVTTLEAERFNLLHRLIDALVPELQQPLLLSAVEGLTSREIGEVMHLPEGTVRTRLMRARVVLREQYQAHQRSTRDREVTVSGVAQ